MICTFWLGAVLLSSLKRTDVVWATEVHSNHPNLLPLSLTFIQERGAPDRRPVRQTMGVCAKLGSESHMRK